MRETESVMGHTCLPQQVTIESLPLSANQGEMNSESGRGEFPPICLNTGNHIIDCVHPHSPR